MPAYGPGREWEAGAADTVDAAMISRMRLVLSVSVLLANFIDHAGPIGCDPASLFVLGGYVGHSFLLLVFSQLNKSFVESKPIHWLDLAWYALIVFSTGSSFFPLFFFAILTSSFRWGFEEGARITVASAALLMACGLLSAARDDLPRLLLRTTFVLALGYMCAQWGESKVAAKRRLALLRDICRLSNPRFGVEHTLTCVLTKIREFFGSASCILVMKDSESGAWSLRTVKADMQRPLSAADSVSEETAAPLMDFPHTHFIAYARSAMAMISMPGKSCAYHCKEGRWVDHDKRPGERLANLLEAKSFIAVPVSLKKGEGRIYVVSRARIFGKADALFLGHIAAQVFPVIENIETIDKMASEAARQERQRIAWDLHDTAIQPYIGLKMGLNAVRNKASVDNPLITDLDKLAAMAAQVIDDLRHYAGTFKADMRKTDSACLAALCRHADRIKEFYGIDIAVAAAGELGINDRLAAEVLQIAREGISNICKHTSAQRGAVSIGCEQGWLVVRIENENPGLSPFEFVPRSIMERVAALGGTAYVEQVPGVKTAVHAEIPI